MGNQGDRQLGNQEAIKLKLDESPEQLDAPDQAISGNQWQSVAISGNEWPSVAIIGNHRLPNSTMLLSPLAKPRGPTICERPAVGDLPWPGEPISTLPPRHISKVGTLRHEKMRRVITSAEVIRGHRRSSEVIRGHQRSSEEVIRSQLMAIRGHQSSSPVFATCHAPVFIAAGNQRPSPLAIRGNQRQSGAITCRSASHVSIAACRRHVRSPCTDRRRRENAQTRASNISFHAAHPRRIPSWSIRRTTCLAKCSTRLSFSAALCGPRA